MYFSRNVLLEDLDERLDRVAPLKGARCLHAAVKRGYPGDGWCLPRRGIDERIDGRYVRAVLSAARPPCWPSDFPI